MKKKFLVLAGVVVASLAMSTSAFAKQGSGDVNRSGSLDIQDAALILQQALDKDYKTANPADASGVLYAWEEANADGDAPFEDTDEITANDAAYVYDKVMNGKQLYLKFTTGQGFSFKVKTSLDDKLIDIADEVLTADESSTYATQINKRKSYINKSIDNVHFYSGSDIVGEVYLREPAGWQIFTDAVAPLIADGCYNTFLNDLAIGNVEADYSVIKEKYILGKTLAKTEVSKEDLQNAYNGVVTITEGRYVAHMTYTDPATGSEVHYSASKVGDADATTVIDLVVNNNLNKYQEITVGDAQAVFGDKLALRVNNMAGTFELIEE